MTQPQEQFEKITSFFCNKLNVSISDVLSGRKKQEFVIARIISIYFCKKLFPFYFGRVYGSYFKVSLTMVSTINSRVEQLKYSDKLIYANLPEYEKEVRAICPTSRDADKLHYCKKLAEIDYCLLVIEKEEIDQSVVRYLKYPAPKILKILSSRLMDFANAEVYRDYSESFNQIAS